MTAMSFSYPTRGPLLCEPERPYNAPRLLTLLRVRVINGEVELACERLPSVEHSRAGRIYLNREHSGAFLVLDAAHPELDQAATGLTRSSNEVP